MHADEAFVVRLWWVGADYLTHHQWVHKG